MSRASNVSRDSTYSMGSLQTGLSGDTSSLPSLMAQNDWEIAPMDIEIMRREDGSPWELGAGAFGKVRARLFPMKHFADCVFFGYRMLLSLTTFHISDSTNYLFIA